MPRYIKSDTVYKLKEATLKYAAIHFLCMHLFFVKYLLLAKVCSTTTVAYDSATHNHKLIVS